MLGLAKFYSNEYAVTIAVHESVNLFKINKNNKFLNPTKFNLLAAKTNVKVIALGGINQLNFKKLNLVKSYGFAGISYFINQNNI